MYDDAEIRTYVAAEAEYFRAHGITVAVTASEMIHQLALPSEV